MRNFTDKYLADLGYIFIVLVWGANFIVIKDALNTLEPVTFNALRLLTALPIFLLIGASNPSMLYLRRTDALRLVIIVVTGPVLYQALFMTGLKYTSSTNGSLMIATLPSWVAIFSLLLGKIEFRRILLLGLALTLLGVVLVIRSSNGNVSASNGDIFGSLVVLAAVMMLATFIIRIKPIVDQYHSLGIAIWTHILVMIGMFVIAAPDLVTLPPLTSHIVPHLLYSGILAAGMGRLAFNFGVKRLGAARSTTYQNFIPVVTALCTVIILGETLVGGVILGGLVTLFGVAIVRRNTQNETTPTSRKLALPHSSGTD